jgi:hypothetical protein
MLPDQFPGENDVVQSIFLALIEGRLDRSQLNRHLQRFVREYNRQHPTKYAKFGTGRLLSLDEVLIEGGTTTRGDNVSQSLWGLDAQVPAGVVTCPYSIPSELR